MTEPDALPPDVHPEAALLPWFVNGTLGGTERQHVDRHLESCALCRREFDELTSMKRRLTATYDAQSAPSTRLARSVMAQVAADARAARDGTSRPSSWLDGMDQRFRSLFLPRWVPTLAVVLLIAQLGLLLWVQLPQPESEEVSRRSLGMQTEAIAVMFQPLATEEQIRVLLRQVGGRITEGPTAEGLYTIEVPSIGASTTERKTDVLRGHTDIVRSAEPVKR
jgi:anti-sigma factor RsiW